MLTWKKVQVPIPLSPCCAVKLLMVKYPTPWRCSTFLLSVPVPRMPWSFWFIFSWWRQAMYLRWVGAAPNRDFWVSVEKLWNKQDASEDLLLPLPMWAGCRGCWRISFSNFPGQKVFRLKTGAAFRCGRRGLSLCFFWSSASLGPSWASHSSLTLLSMCRCAQFVALLQSSALSVGVISMISCQVVHNRPRSAKKLSLIPYSTKCHVWLWFYSSIGASYSSTYGSTSVQFVDSLFPFTFAFCLLIRGLTCRKRLGLRQVFKFSFLAVRLSKHMWMSGWPIPI